ncbi:MAG: glucose-1-phosphate adenylyltransferase [Planctomycetota bacterium]
MRNAVAMILGGGRGTRLSPLTSIRSKPAVPLAGMYRLIDIPISNCINSNINRIYVLTQFMSVSLHGHIRRTYNFDRFNGGYVELLAAQETSSPGTDWYQGTADAVRKNLRYIQQPGMDYVVILSGDQLYRMDYREMIKTHVYTGADVTIACMPVDRQAARGFGVMQLNDDGRITGFVEKPQTDEEIDKVRTDPAWIDARGIPSKGRDCLASMGIYVFNRDLLTEVLTNTEHRDFGKEVFPETIETHKVQTHLFDGYWEDIGTIRSFYEANLALAAEEPSFELTSSDAPVYTRPRFLAPSRVSGASVKGSLVANGCSIGEGSVIENSIIGLRTVIGKNVTIKNSILMGNDYYHDQTNAPSAGLEVPMGIGDDCVIDGAIVDKDCCIGRGVRIVNSSNRDQTDLEHPTCVIRDGIPIIVKAAELKDGWDLEKDV